jgi:DNA polymerase III sliding clamp (beta) subunit (PCNA family)
MKRKDLLDLLAEVRPALATSESLSQLFTHYCFDGKHLTAYNGASLGVTVPFASPFKGGVPGKTLDDLLTHISDDDVTITPGNGNIEIKAGKAVMTLATIPADDLASVFDKEFSEAEGQEIKATGKELLGAVSCCLNSLGADAGRSDQTGLLFRRDKDFLVVYGFNNISLSVAEVPLEADSPGLSEEGVLLPGVFCKRMVDYLKADNAVRFEIGERYAMFSTGKVNVYGTLIPRPTKIDYDKILDDNFPTADSKKLVAIPDGLKKALERACVIVNTKLDGKLRTEVEVKAGTARLFSRSARGEVEDIVELPNHPDVKLAIDPRPVLDAMPFFGVGGRVLFEHKCAVLNRKAQTYMVAAFQPSNNK